MTGIRARVRVVDHRACPVARISAEGPPVESVVRDSFGDPTAVTEVTTPPGSVVANVEGVEQLQRVFSTEDGEQYRLVHDRHSGCVCSSIERHGHVAREVRAEDGDLVVTFFAPDLPSLREVMVALKDRHEGVSMERLDRSGDERSVTDPTVVDRAVLTDRQREVLTTAYERGYFEYPKRANASEIAADLGVSRSTFVEHLSAAQSKILDAIVEDI